jgi:MCM OB domain/MCM N-terminal domain
LPGLHIYFPLFLLLPIAVIRELAQNGGTVLSLDVQHLFLWSEEDGSKLYLQLRSYPNEVIPIMDIVINQELERIKGDLLQSRQQQDAENYLTDEENERINEAMNLIVASEQRMAELFEQDGQLRPVEAEQAQEMLQLEEQVKQRASVEHLDGSSADDESSESAELRGMRQRLRDTQAAHEATRARLQEILNEYEQEGQKKAQQEEVAVYYQRLASERAGQNDNLSNPNAAPIKVRVHNLDIRHRMRDLDPTDIDTLVAVRGMVVRCSAPIPDMKTGWFRCVSCGNGIAVDVDRGHLHEPDVCGRCGAKRSFEMVHNRCTFLDKQHIKMQETPESIPEGETPQTILLYAFQELVDGCAPGDRVEITGIYRAIGIRPNPRQRALRSVFKTYIDIIHIKKGGNTGAAGGGAAATGGLIDSQGNELTGSAANQGMSSMDEKVATEEPVLAGFASDANAMLPGGGSSSGGCLGGDEFDGDSNQSQSQSQSRDRGEMEAWNNDIYAGTSTMEAMMGELIVIHWRLLLFCFILLAC